jgi:hypothetical protein
MQSVETVYGAQAFLRTESGICVRPVEAGCEAPQQEAGYLTGEDARPRGLTKPGRARSRRRHCARAETGFQGAIAGIGAGNATPRRTCSGRAGVCIPERSRRTGDSIRRYWQTEVKDFSSHRMCRADLVALSCGIFDLDLRDSCSRNYGPRARGPYPIGCCTAKVATSEARLGPPPEPRQPNLTESPCFSVGLQPVESETDPERQKQNQYQRCDTHEDTSPVVGAIKTDRLCFRFKSVGNRRERRASPSGVFRHVLH